MLTLTKRWAWVLLLAATAGCSRTSAPPIDTGARAVVHSYYEALLRQEWQQAYAALHPDNQARLSQQQFTLLAEAYRRQLGFNPEAVHVVSCEEQNSEALAHVVLTGHVESKQWRYKDAVALRQNAEGWRVVLSDTFGRNVR